ncbi:hypothetical protein GCM10010353_37690 [Streptomyces chryseus]|nr:hypothetical protein GCM10010353_37690 [Streptomyces chryseus]
MTANCHIRTRGPAYGHPHIATRRRVTKSLRDGGCRAVVRAYKSCTAARAVETKARTDAQKGS